VFVRFVVETIDPESGRRQGVFHAAKTLRESGAVTEEHHARLLLIQDWFNENLEKPSRLSLSSRPHAKAQCVSWFKDSARQHIRKMNEFKEILEGYGVAVQMIKVRRPGYIVYEDEFQVSAYPFSDTQT
jgi:hypothetical protein